MRKLAPRFLPILRASWLALKRNNFYRDLRKLILSWVASNLFEWETESLRNDFFQMPIPRQVVGSIPVIVEKCPKLPFPQRLYDEDKLRLVKVTMREFNYQPQKKVFRWLHK